MNTVTKTRKTKSKSRNDRFNKLWRRAEKLQGENARLRERLDALVERVRREVAPAEAERAEAARDLVLHLLQFQQRKSLTQWQREEIRDWIEQEMSIVMAAGAMDETLRDALARDWAMQRGVEIDEDSDLSAAQQVEPMARREQEAEDELLDDIMERARDEMESAVQREVEARVRARFGTTRGPDPAAAADDLFADELDQAARERAEEIERFRRETERDVRRRMEEEYGPAPEERLAEETDPQGPRGAPGDSDPAAAPAIDRGVFERLFRRAANALHPDKEQDEARRAEKQGLMGRLLEARGNGDILTVYRLHREHSGGALELDAHDENELLDALEHQIECLEGERDAIIQQSPAHQAAYEDFYRQPEKLVERRLAELREDISKGAAEMRGCVREVRTLKALKPVLEERREDRMLGLVYGIEGHEFF